VNWHEHWGIVRGIRLRWLFMPSGPRTLLCWPGTGLPAEQFQGLAKAAGRCGYSVVALDPPGHGASDPWPGPAWTTADASAILTALMRWLRAPRVLLAGHSLGGTTVLLAHPALGASVVGVAVLDGGLPMREPPADADAAVSAVREWAANQRVPDRGRWLATVQSELAHWDADVETGALAMMRETPGGLEPRVDADTIGRMLWWLARYTLDDIPESPVPVLWLHGEHGRPDAEAAANIERRLAHVRFASVRAGHELLWDAPEAVATAVLGFADGLAW
jgi:pimeloyl-ACP methyl ester carboxylesterase